MPYVDTDDSSWLNSECIVSIQRGLCHPYTPEHAERTLHTWELTILMRDGTRHKLTGERAAAAIQVLELPTRIAWSELPSLPAEAVEVPDGSDLVPAAEAQSDADDDAEVRAHRAIAENLFADLSFDALAAPDSASKSDEP